MPPPMHMVTTRVLRAAPLAFDQDMAGHARAAHAERMADRDRAAVHVELVLRNAEPVAAVEHLAGERLVQLPQVDVVHLHAGALQQLRHREHRADAHLVRLAARDREAAERAERLQALLLGELGAHHHAGRRAVGELARIAGRDEAALAHRLEAAQAFEVGVRAVALVALERDVLDAFRLGVLVDHLLLRRQRHDLVLEAARPAGPRRCGAGFPANTRPAPRGSPCSAPPRCRRSRSSASRLPACARAASLR